MRSYLNSTRLATSQHTLLLTRLASIATYNELLALHEAYSAFAVRKQAAISHTEQLGVEGVRQVKEIIRAHDVRANEMARQRPVMAPLPPSVSKWLS